VLKQFRDKKIQTCKARIYWKGKKSDKPQNFLDEKATFSVWARENNITPKPKRTKKYDELPEEQTPQKQACSTASTTPSSTPTPTPTAPPTPMPILTPTTPTQLQHHRSKQNKPATLCSELQQLQPQQQQQLQQQQQHQKQQQASGDALEQRQQHQQAADRDAQQQQPVQKHHGPQEICHQCSPVGHQKADVEKIINLGMVSNEWVVLALALTKTRQESATTSVFPLVNDGKVSAFERPPTWVEADWNLNADF